MPAIAIQRPVATLNIPLGLQGKLDAALMTKLNALDAGTLGKLQNGFFDAAAGAQSKMGLAGTSMPFACTAPSEAFMPHFSTLQTSYFRPSIADNVRPQPDANSPGEQESKKPSPESNRSYGAQSKGPGIFSNPAAEKAAAALRQQQTQTQTFLQNQMGQSFARGDMSQFLGSQMCFEDALAALLFKLADKDQRDLMDQLRMYERNDTGLNGLVAKGANALGGAVGATAGGIVGSALGSPSVGAAVGYDIGERIAGNVSGQYGTSSKQVQYQKIQMAVNNMSQLMQLLSNVLHSSDSTNKLIISNMRG